MEKKESPFEYHNDKLGAKIKFLIKSDKLVSSHEKSLKLISYRALYGRMKSKTQPERELRRASLGFDALVEFDSLVQEWRDALVFEFGKPTEKTRASFFEKHYISDRNAFDFFAAHRYGDDNNKKLPPEAIELYTYNASVLNTILEVRQKRKLYAKSLGLTGQFDIWQSLSNDVNAFQQVNHDLPTTKDSLRHKVNRYIKESYSSIISKKYGSRNAAKVKDNEQLALIEVLLGKHQNLNNEQIVRHYNDVAGAIGWKTIDAGVIANYREKLDLYVFAGQHGETNLMHQKHMQIKRSKPSASMLFWSMDGWDAELLYQKTSVDKNGNTVTTYHNRLTAVMILDPFNNYIVGYAIGEKESPTLIRSALKNALKHTEELFGAKYKPYQLQTDHYQLKNLQPTYEATAKHFTPAKVKNAKSKPVEQFFDKFNEKHFQEKLVLNWSGHNVTANNDNQVNGDYLAKHRHLFPDKAGCIAQIENAIANERSEKVEAFVNSFLAFEDKTEMTLNQFLRTYGLITGYTNKMEDNGLTPTIEGIKRFYDSFDLSFRKYMHEDWMVFYDSDDLSQILVSNAKSRDGRLIEEIGTMEFILTEKYIQPMALYDQEKGDAQQRQLVYDYNRRMNDEIILRGTQQRGVLEDLFDNNPKLDTLKKLMIPDSLGQHKDQKATERLKKSTERIAIKQEKREKVLEESNWQETQTNYLKEKVNLNKYTNL